jgi:RNA polymerase sigma-70 factor, ECF subfamily
VSTMAPQGTFPTQVVDMPGKDCSRQPDAVPDGHRPARATRLHAGLSDGELQEIMAQARAGDSQALGTLYELYSVAIFRYLCRRTGDSELAQDLTSRVFLKVLEAIRSQHCWQESFSNWLYCVARNLLIDHVHATARQPHTGLLDTIPCQQAAAMEDNVERSCTADEVRQALGDLPPAHTQVLALRFGAGLRHAEVGRLLGKNEDTVKVTQHRALRALRTKLLEYPSFQAVEGYCGRDP